MRQLKRKVIIYTDNDLKNYHTVFGNSNILFRELICYETGWSEATFYRKMRNPKVLSKLEKRGIRKCYKSVLKELIKVLQ